MKITFQKLHFKAKGIYMFFQYCDTGELGVIIVILEQELQGEGRNTMQHGFDWDCYYPIWLSGWLVDLGWVLYPCLLFDWEAFTHDWWAC